MKVKKELKSSILKILPCLQSDIWKNLHINHRQCSRIMKSLEDDNIIKRTKVKGGTYMVEKVSVNGNEPNKAKDKFYALISSKGRFSPCVKCDVVCDPKICNVISEWILE